VYDTFHQLELQVEEVELLFEMYKEDPDKFYLIIDTWKKENISKECEWVIKHGSRNVKEG